ncbi:MAG: sugar transferase [Eubacteriales bacterium]|nr:sugar transferase [Eubacteriales bacterium]
MYRRNEEQWYKHFDFVVLDLLCIELSFLLAFAIRFCKDLDIKSLFFAFRNSEIYGTMLLFLVVLHVVYIIIAIPYAGIIHRNAADEFKKVLIYNIFLFTGMIVALFVVKSSSLYSRIVIFLYPVINTPLMFVCRHVNKKIIRKRLNKESHQSCMIVFAAYEELEGIIQHLTQNPIQTIRIVGIALTDPVITPDMKQDYMGIPVLGDADAMYEYARTNVVDEVMLCMSGEKTKRVVDTLTSMGIVTHINIEKYFRIKKGEVNNVYGIPVITTGVMMMTARQIVIKRLVDVILGLIGSVVTIVLTIFIAPMIWIADPGPVFFRQERVGQNGRKFKIWKFRTMYKDAEARKAELLEQNEMNGLMFKMEDDPRIIGYGKKFKLGAFLRKFSIDELPQSFNILEGSMSVVGTRPPTVEEYEKYDLHHKGRLAMKPGLTGMWQISGRNKITDFEQVVELDKQYVDQFCLRLDLEIMFKTIKVVLGRDGSM